jgi:alkanesulfonate monooxygenase SsuD/methylene tetrahydromethanopterin reductase-like flavin-dependent oxidoreductase (luciferase family)
MGADRVKLGVLLPTRSLLLMGDENADLILRMAERAEEAGLDSVWVGDSLTAKPRLDPLTTLAAVAARTQRVRLGTAVLLAALRHPVLLAHAVHTLDFLSQGRLVLAVGVGGAFNESQKREWLAAGVEPSQRARRLEELIILLKRLGAEERVTFAGEHFRLDSVHIEPRPVRSGGVPILLACHLRAGREAQFRRAAELGDGFISISESPEGYAQIADKVRTYAEELGKDFRVMESAIYITVNLNRDEERAEREADRFITRYYGMNIWKDIWGPNGPPERLIESIRRYAQAGAKTVIVRFASFDQEGQLDLFVNEVLPAFQH